MIRSSFVHLVGRGLPAARGARPGGPRLDKFGNIHEAEGRNKKFVFFE